MPVLYRPRHGFACNAVAFFFIIIIITTNSTVFFYVLSNELKHATVILYICTSALFKLVVPLCKHPATATSAVGD